MRKVRVVKVLHMEVKTVKDAVKFAAQFRKIGMKTHRHGNIIEVEIGKPRIEVEK